MLSVGRRADSDIDGYVEYRSAGYAKQFALGMRRCLKMQTAQRSGLGRQGMIILDKIDCDPCFSYRLAAQGFKKEPSRITMDFGNDSFTSAMLRGRISTIKSSRRPCAPGCRLSAIWHPS